MVAENGCGGLWTAAAFLPCIPVQRSKTYFRGQPQKINNIKELGGNKHEDYNEASCAAACSMHAGVPDGRLRQA
jgi:hypothetical protein